MAGGVLLWAAATLAMGFVGGFTSLLLLRVLLGVGETIAFPGASKSSLATFPPSAAAWPMRRWRSGLRSARPSGLSQAA
jgi:MFS family permease